MPTIEPKKITNYKRAESELESFWLFCILVAGKNSDWAAKKVADLIANRSECQTPLDFVGSLGDVGLRNFLVANKVGQYNRIERAFRESHELKRDIGSIEHASLNDLLEVFGVGPKTARFFLLHSRRDCRCAVLDTHILKWLKEIFPDAPTSTPTTKKNYLFWEESFLSMASVYFPDLTLAQVDLYLWTKYSGRLAGEDLIGKKAYKTELP